MTVTEISTKRDWRNSVLCAFGFLIGIPFGYVLWWLASVAFAFPLSLVIPELEVYPGLIALLCFLTPALAEFGITLAMYRKQRRSGNLGLSSGVMLAMLVVSGGLILFGLQLTIVAFLHS